MPKYYEKRPAFTAHQFDGSEDSISNLRGLIGKVVRWQIKGERMGVTTIEFEREDGIKIDMKAGDYAVSPARDTVYVLSDEDFQAKYEAATPAPAFCIPQAGLHIGMLQPKPFGDS